MADKYNGHVHDWFPSGGRLVCNICECVISLPELTSAERSAIDSFPNDAVEHWMKGERWNGKEWVESEMEAK